MGKRFFKFTVLISLIFFAINVDVLAEGDSDDHACPDGDQGPVISCGRYEGLSLIHISEPTRRS